MDFYNTKEGIKEAFDPFYTATTLSEATDVNILHQLKTTLLTFGVFDMDGRADSAVNRAFLKNAEKRGRTSTAGDDLPRTFVVTDSEVIFTHISTSAIVGRSG